MQTFRPIWRNPHLLTIAGNFWPRTLDEVRFPVERRFFETAPGVRVLGLLQRPAGPSQGTLILLHGLEGSADGGYMRSMAQTALETGYTTVRLNMRGCGGTESHCNTLYHAGLTADLLHIVHELAPQGPLSLIGYSLGGNVVLKLAGELGEAARPLIERVCAVSTPINLAECVRRLGHPQNRMYEWRFVRRMKQRLIERHRHRPELFPIAALERIRTVYQFDDLLTAPHFGFGDAPNYYATQSARNFLARICIPAVLIQSKDDPLVPYSMFEEASAIANPHIELISVDHGGHLGFLAGGAPRFWLDHTILNWLRKGTNSRHITSPIDRPNEYQRVVP